MHVPQGRVRLARREQGHRHGVEDIGIVGSHVERAAKQVHGLVEALLSNEDAREIDPVAHAVRPRLERFPEELLGFPQAIRAHGGRAGLQQWADLTYEADATFTFGTTEVQGTATVHVRDGRMLRDVLS